MDDEPEDRSASSHGGRGGEWSRRNEAQHVWDLAAKSHSEDHREQDVERPRNGSRNRNRLEHGPPPVLMSELRRQLASHQLGKESFMRSAKVGKTNLPFGSIQRPKTKFGATGIAE